MDSKSEALRNFLFGLDFAHRVFAISRIAELCGVSRATVRNWYSGRSNIKRAAMAAINSEFGLQIFSL